ncbi:hypothetical protein [Listeria booriae]|uniref:Rad50/SbcC-type AAA domain-containing protein n=4 Tax=Listeria booriae TaxID=1552123 RepID=A0A7X1DJ31_9LIST|nr:hypothetical protein [Listeria booriae]MBC2309553.1 hypothetical protein [Listeria booriae]
MSRIIIKRLVILGPSYKRTLPFIDGLNIISGVKTSGKSLILRLIDYGLGKSKKFNMDAQRVLDMHCDTIYLEIGIGDEVFTIRRHLKKSVDTVHLYSINLDEIDDYIPLKKSLRELNIFLMRKLQISEVKLVKNKARSADKETQIISFRDIFRYVYIPQHELGTNNFLNNESVFKRQKNPYAFEVICKIIEGNRNEIQEEIAAVENQINKLVNGKNSVYQYLVERDEEDYAELIDKKESIERKINSYNYSKEEVIANSQLNKNKENELYVKLKNQIGNLVDTIYNVRREASRIQQRIDSKKYLISNYSQEIKELDMTIEANYMLKKWEQVIECPLCNSEVTRTNDEYEIDMSRTELVELKKEKKKKIDFAESIIAIDTEKVRETEIEIDYLTNQKNIFEEAILVFSKKTNVPFLSEINTLNKLIIELQKELEIVKECLRVHRNISEKEKEIKSLDLELIRLKRRLTTLNIEENKKIEIFNFLDTQYKGFMSKFKYNHLEGTYIDRDKYVPFHDYASVFEHESGGLLECMQIAFLCSILSGKQENMAPGHPGFLLLDTISKYLGTIESSESDGEIISDPIVYDEIYRVIIELSSSYQMILVDNTPPEKYKKYIRYIFLDEESGLINLNLNEI